MSDASQKEWQVAEIEAGLAEADRGEFAAAAELSGVIAEYGKMEAKATASRLSPNQTE